MSVFMGAKDVFTGGKYKGEALAQVFHTDPGYLSWALHSGFRGFDSEVLNAIETWEQKNPGKVRGIKNSIAKYKKEGKITPSSNLDKGSYDKVDGSFIPSAAPTEPQRPAEWGSW